MTLDEFIKIDCRSLTISSGRFVIPSNHWIKWNGIAAYLRRSSRYIDGQRVNTFEIATVEVVRKSGRGKGLFKSFVAHIEKNCKEEYLYVECVIRHRFQMYFESNGWTKADSAIDISPNYYKKINRKDL